MFDVIEYLLAGLVLIFFSAFAGNLCSGRKSKIENDVSIKNIEHTDEKYTFFDNIRFNSNKKFDIQLSQALINERRLANIFAKGKIEKIELKSETWQWEKTGNICIEYKANGQPSGISTTEADYWVHELKRNNDTLLYLMFPIDRLKQMAREQIKAGNVRHGGGDGRRFDNVIIPLRDILK